MSRDVRSKPFPGPHFLIHIPLKNAVIVLLNTKLQHLRSISKITSHVSPNGDWRHYSRLGSASGDRPWIIGGNLQDKLTAGFTAGFLFLWTVVYLESDALCATLRVYCIMLRDDFLCVLRQVCSVMFSSASDVEFYYYYECERMLESFA